MESDNQITETIENTATSGVLTPEAISAPYLKSPSEMKHGHPTHSRGPKLAAERIFDASVYGVWNYGIQAGTSVAASMWFHEGGGKPYFDKSAEWLGKNVVEKITSKRGAAAAAEAHTPLMFTSLITVGNLFIPPMRWVEKDKVYYVSKINDWLNERRIKKGDAPSVKELAEQKAELAAIANEPRQSSKELWTGRGLGLLANYVVASGLAGEKNNVKMKNVFADTVSHGLDTVGLKSLAGSEKMKSFSRMAFLDYGYSFLSSNIVYAYGHYINPPTHERPIPVVEVADIKQAKEVSIIKPTSKEDKDDWASAPTHKSHEEHVKTSGASLEHMGGIA